MAAGDKQYREHKLRIVNIWNLVLILILLLVSLGDCYLLYRTASEQYQIRLEETGERLAEAVQDKMNMALQYLEGLAECFFNKEDIHSREALDTLIRVEQRNLFTKMWLTKIDGRAISSDMEEADAADQEYLERAKKGESGISQVQTWQMNGEHNVVLFAPTYYQGNVSGMLIGILQLDTLLEVMKVQGFSGRGYCAVITETGEVLVSNGEAKVESESRYDYLIQTSVLDWSILVSFPESVIAGEIQYDLILTAVIGLIYALVCGLIIVNTFRDRSRILREKASQDSLTLLSNRGTIEQIVGQMGEGREKDAVLMIFDIDKFKQVNDTLGHSVGDILLKAVAELMRREFKDADCLCRMGGDEFGIFIREVADREALLQRVDRLRDKVGQLSLAGSLKCTISIGLVFVAGSGELNTFDTIYQRADKAMYISKKAGGNRVTVYSAEQ